MDELIIRSLRGPISTAEEAALRAWRASSAENERRYRDVVALWEVTGVATPAGRRPVPSAASIMGMTAAGPRRLQRSLARRAVERAAVIAATLVIGLGIGFLYSSGPSQEAAALELVTGVEETTVAHLPDGTVVRLGPGSRLRSVTGTTSREAWLEGTAFFAVAHDAARPYVVRSDGGEARVLGTRFQLVSRDSEIDLTVLEGTVALASGGDEVLVRSGEASGARGGGRPEPIRAADLEASLRWLGGFIAFQSTPLRLAVAELEARFETPIHLAEPAIGDIAVTAWFADGSLDEVLSVICRVADVRCSLRDGAVRIEP